MSYDVYLAAMILDLLFYFAITVAVLGFRDSSFYFVNHTAYKTTSGELIFGIRP